jgi:hypothetical protein
MTEHTGSAGQPDTGSTDFPPGLSQPAIRALTQAGYTRLEQLAATTEAELLALHGVGPKAIRILNEAFAERGLQFAGKAPATPDR